MNKSSTLIYQFNSLQSNVPVVFDLQELLKAEYILKRKLKNFKHIRLKSPKIEVLQSN